MKNLAILGSTGSIGCNTLDVVRRHGDKCRVWALVAGRNVEKLLQQIVEFRPRVAVVASEAAREELRQRLRQIGLPLAQWPELGWGPKARVAAACAAEVGFVMSAIVGVAGLEATYEAARLGRTIGLANKETLVAGGKLVTEAARAAGAELIPVDSEHNGVHQCLRAGCRSEVARVFLTASGGPFRDTPPEVLRGVTPEAALNHPTWKMGKRITIDSATLMNKGFEVIEACWLFGLSAQEVEVVIHPQSSVHAMVEFKDGSVLAQVSATDMRMPIQYALTYPERAAAAAPRLDWGEPRVWEFRRPDFAKFPLLRLAYAAQGMGGSATCTLNAADEVAVEAFLEGRITFPAIAEVVEEALTRIPSRQPGGLDEIMEIDRESRQAALAAVSARSGRAGQSSAEAMQKAC
ncbi:MAG: 1-deoxy-D-xylulose-5-phosphate reductoisomerase [Acidobacteria bacterium]|nr:1-deoxy-D-xylulose-5-phosphate reductoisomerase [Acidobacteriota bacterium]